MMNDRAAISLLLALSFLTAGSAFALGLGNAVGQAALGAPLRIEIPLIGSEAGIPAIECFDIRPPQAEIASVYVLRNAQLQVVGAAGRATLVVSSSSPVQEPVLEFAVSVSCGFGLSKDYLLLAEEPGKAEASLLPTAQPIPTPVETRTRPTTHAGQQAPGATVPVAGDGLLRVTTTLTLAELARQTYPLQPKAREKFMRMILRANPDLTGTDSPIDGGSELKAPPGLPLRRQGSRPPALKPPLADHSIVVSAASLPDDTTPASAKPRRDLLVLGGAAERNRSPAELLAEAEHLAAVMLEQNKTQDAFVERIGKLDDTLGQLKKHFVNLTDRLDRIEAERQAEKLASRPASLDVIELLAAVLAGGLIGALSLYFFNRRQLLRPTESPPATNPSVASKPARAANLPGIAEQPVASAAISPPNDLSPATQAPTAQDDFDFSSISPLSFSVPPERRSETNREDPP